jgi:hypothetical protein
LSKNAGFFADFLKIITSVPHPCKYQEFEKRGANFSENHFYGFALAASSSGLVSVGKQGSKGRDQGDQIWQIFAY